MREKSILRTEVQDQLHSLPKQDLDLSTKKIILFLKTVITYYQYPHVACYWPIKKELDLAPLYDEWLDQKKQLYFPRFNIKNKRYDIVEIKNIKKDLIIGKYNILEPSPILSSANPKIIDLWIIPGIAFDGLGNRLGRGKGYYDQLLANTTAVKLGVCFEAQFKRPNLIQTEAHDVKMDVIISEEKIIKTS